MSWPVLTALLGAASAGARPVEDVWVRIDGPDDQATVAALGLGFAEGSDGTWRRFHGEPGSARALDRAGLEWRWSPHPPGGRTGSGYTSPEQLVEALDSLAAEHPELVSRVDVGTSVDERPIAGVRITATDQPRASWRILGAHHGDEQSSSELALLVALDLVEAYGSDADTTRLLDTDEVWVVPMVNPDGVAADSRYNAHSVDLNRNYGFQWSADEFRPGDRAFSEPETRSVRALSSWTPFAAGLSLHSGATNIGWVWNYTREHTPDEALLEVLADVYADACGQGGFWTTNGADWYITHGDANDWSYGAWGALDYTVEVSTTKTPDESELDAVLDSHAPAVAAFLAWEPVVAGQVVDAVSGRGIPATITPIEGGRALASGPDGRFARPIEPESTWWTIEASAPGYASALVDIAIGETARIVLEPDSLQSLRPTPTLLSWGTTGTFTLAIVATEVVLTRPGAEPVVASASHSGWQVDLESLQPGPWTLQVDGAVAPRSLFVGEIDDAVSITDAWSEGGVLHVVGAGFGAGTRAWALWGEARAPVALALLTEDDGTLQLDGSALDHADGPVDIVVLSQGRQLAVLDVLGDAVVDTDAPEDTGPTDDGHDSGDGPDRAPAIDRVAAPGCGCTTGAVPPAIPFPLILLAAARRRRHPHRREP